MTPVYVAAALSGFTALGAEVVWTRQLSLLFGASVYTFSLILAVFLAGLGVGSYVGSYLARRAHRAAGGARHVFRRCSPARSASARAPSSTCCRCWQPTALFLPGVRSSPA